METDFSSVSRHDTKLEIAHLNSIRGVTAELENGKCVIKFRSTAGAVKITVDQNERKVRLKEIMRKIVETKELEKDGSKSMDLRKMISTLLRLKIIFIFNFLSKLF